MAGFSILTQPSSSTRSDQPIFPPIIVKSDVLTAKEVEDANNVIASVSLLDERGQDIPGALQGDVSISGTLGPDEGGLGERQTFTFSNLTVKVPGRYTIRVYVYRISHVGSSVGFETTLLTNSFEAN